jgi:hypothetical protein
LGIAPVTCRLACVHFAEKKTQHSLTVFPVEVSEFDGDFVGRVVRGKGALEVWHLGELGSRLDQREELRLSEVLVLKALLFLKLRLEFAALLLLHLLKGLQEELLDVRALVQNHLANSLEIKQLCSFETNRLLQRCQLMVLLLNHLLVLELQEFAFFFEISDDLGETFLEQVYLCLEHFDLLVLFELGSRVLVDSHSLLRKLSLESSILLFDLFALADNVVELLILKLGFILKSLVLNLNVAFDFRDVLFCLGLRAEFEVFEKLCILGVDGLLLSFHVLLALLLDLG